MPYIRLSIVKPLRGQEAHVESLVRRISEVASDLDGCLESYVLHPHDESGEIARLAIYRDLASADQAASNATLMSVRSELNMAVEPGHIERGFTSS